MGKETQVHDAANPSHHTSLRSDRHVVRHMQQRRLGVGAAWICPQNIFIDEAGQLTVAGLAIIMTTFVAWLAITLLGDPKQLLPFLNSGRANEFMENAVTSVIELLEEKGYPTLRLEWQYRMAASIARWPTKIFYQGLLKNHSSVLVDDDNSKRARKISKEFYGIEGPHDTGSEYWMVNVINGISRVQLNGTSLENHSNADAISTLVDRTLAAGVMPPSIYIYIHTSLLLRPAFPGQPQDRREGTGKRKDLAIRLRRYRFNRGLFPGRGK